MDEKFGMRVKNRQSGRYFDTRLKLISLRLKIKLCFLSNFYLDSVNYNFQ